MNHATARPATILLVEDTALSRDVLAYILTNAGYQVLEAIDGQEGVELFTQQPDAIDLVVSDLMMPRLSGLEMLQLLKCLRPAVKMILITGAPVDAPAWREQGVHDWLIKSFAPNQLLDKIATALVA